MDELWTVEFSLTMIDFGCSTPGASGELFVRGTDIFDVLEKAKNRLAAFGFDHVNICSANRCENRKEENDV